MVKGSSRLNLIDRLNEKFELKVPKVRVKRLVERAIGELGEEGSEAKQATRSNGANRRELDEVSSDRGRDHDATWHSSEARNYTELDLDKMGEAGYVIPDGRRSRIKEQYRNIKRPLLVNAFQKTDENKMAHIVLVTSACPGEGKTFTATNLAMSIAAEREIKVLLMDGDVIRQDLSQRFGIEANKGYLDLLDDDTLDVSDILFRTNVPSLAVLPSGVAREEATELFASTRMNDLMDDLAARYHDRIIIIDTPPILASSETNALAPHTGQYVIVIEAGKTSQQTVEEALHLLTPCEYTYCILNKAADADLIERYGSYQEYYITESRG